jgi:hypothetical protein
MTTAPRQVRNKWVATRLAGLRWISMLLTKMPDVIYKSCVPVRRVHAPSRPSHLHPAYTPGQALEQAVPGTAPNSL